MGMAVGAVAAGIITERTGSMRTPSPTTKPSDNSVPHALGQFVGHIWRGLRADTASSRAREVGRHTEEQETLDAAGQRVTLRRTTIDEIEIRPNNATPGDGPHDGS